MDINKESWTFVSVQRDLVCVCAAAGCLCCGLITVGFRLECVYRGRPRHTFSCFSSHPVTSSHPSIPSQQPHHSLSTVGHLKCRGHFCLSSLPWCRWRAVTREHDFTYLFSSRTKRQLQDPNWQCHESIFYWLLYCQNSVSKDTFHVVF